MDEPLSNLDAKLRVSMRAELAKLHERLGVTTVYVTHDQVEAMTLGQRVAVLRDGLLQQVDTPQHALPQPGEPVRGRVHRLAVDEPRRRRRSTATSSDSPASTLALPAGVPLAGANRSVILGIRPTDFEHARRGADLPRMRVRLDVVEDLGAESHLIFTIDAPRVSAEAVRAAADLSRRTTRGSCSRRRAGGLHRRRRRAKRAIDAGLGGRARGRPPRSLHFFDPATGHVVGAERQAVASA